jgi:hypothetical protein
MTPAPFVAILGARPTQEEIMAENLPESPDAIAYKILMGIAANEGKPMQGDYIIADKAWTLATLREIYVAMNTLTRK